MRIIQTLRLKEDPILVEEYKKAHKNVWPEVIDGIKAVGIQNMEIYINGYTLFMIMDVPDDFNREEAFARLATLPRQAEWEKYVEKFQQSTPGASSGEKWKEAEKIFGLNDPNKLEK